MTNAIKKMLNIKNGKQFISYTNYFAFFVSSSLSLRLLYFLYAGNEKKNVHQTEMEQK